MHAHTLNILTQPTMHMEPCAGDICMADIVRRVLLMARDRYLCLLHDCHLQVDLYTTWGKVSPTPCPLMGTLQTGT